MLFYVSQHVFKIFHSKQNWKQNMMLSSVNNTVPANGLASLGETALTRSGTTNYGSCIYFGFGPVFELFNKLKPRENLRHFAENTFKCIFLNEDVRIFIKISLKFVPKGPINNIPALVQLMAWHWPGDKPLSEPMMVRLLMHICVTRPQWVDIHKLVGFVEWFHRIMIIIENMDGYFIMYINCSL